MLGGIRGYSGCILCQIWLRLSLKVDECKSLERGRDERGRRRSGTTKPPLRVAIDTSYDQDSQKAIRSVAKQLSECLVRRVLRTRTRPTLNFLLVLCAGMVCISPKPSP